MDNKSIKVSLTIELEGSVILRDGEGNKVMENGVSVKKAAKLHKQLSLEVYNEMRSGNVPSWFVNQNGNVKKAKSNWHNMSASDRFNAHLANTTSHYGGKSFTYHVFEK